LCRPEVILGEGALRATPVFPAPYLPFRKNLCYLEQYFAEQQQDLKKGPGCLPENDIFDRRVSGLSTTPPERAELVKSSG
jgi:hypothetical protein